MFLNYYGLKEQPFGVTPDARYLYLSNTHREALASLFYGLETGRGFMAMIAKPGMGKTTLLGHILKKFQRTARTAFLFNTQCNSREFLESLASELGFECNSTSLVQFLEDFNRNLIREAKARRRCIVVIDEAQNLDASVLETARLLSNFETPRAKLLQIIFAGQPELAHKLGSPALSQLRQRISMFNRLEPLTAEETGRYIYHRLGVAGYTGSDLFPAETVAAIAKYSEGIPRIINNLCFGALSLGFATKRTTIDVAMIKEVVTDLDVNRLGPKLEAVPPVYRNAMREPESSDGGAPIFPFVQSAMTFGRLLRKVDLTGTGDSAELEEASPSEGEEEVVVPDSTAKWPQVVRK